MHKSEDHCQITSNERKQFKKKSSVNENTRTVVEYFTVRVIFFRNAVLEMHLRPNISITDAKELKQIHKLQNTFRKTTSATQRKKKQENREKLQMYIAQQVC